MTDHTDLIARLRKGYEYGDSGVVLEAASALEAAQAEIERLTADRRVLQADGKHPAPCAKFCEATAFTIELRRAQAEIERLENRIEDLTSEEHSIPELRQQIAESFEEKQKAWKCIAGHQMAIKNLLADRDQALARLAEVEGYKDGAYTERNKLVALLSKLLPSGTKRTAIEGWSDDWHGCVYIDLPTGQASWHYHDSQAHLFAHLPPYAGTWDGHTTEQKYERIAGYAAAGASPLTDTAAIDAGCRYITPLLTQGASPVQPSPAGELSTEQLLYVQSALKAVEQYGNIFRYERHQVIRYEKIVDALAIVDAAINAKESGK